MSRVTWNRVAVVGATGAVGQEIERVVAQRGWEVGEWRLLASPRSAGMSLDWAGAARRVDIASSQAFEQVELALFAAGGAISRELAPAAVDHGAIVVDNSSAFRLDPEVPLVVPEVNRAALAGHRGVIANPNCSTILLSLVLAPLHAAAPIRRAVVSTYQAASGAGAAALAELESQSRAVLNGDAATPRIFPVPCAFNVFSHNSPIDASGFNVEERKMVAEARKILDAPELSLAVTCLRVPVMRAHTETVALEFETPVSADVARDLLGSAAGVRVVDDWAAGAFPTALDAAHTDDVLVGRIRQDPTVMDGCGLQLMLSGDQLRKGAALNAVQIAEQLP